MGGHPASREERLALARAAVTAARATKVRPRARFWSRWTDRLRHAAEVLWELIKELPGEIAHAAMTTALTLGLLYLWEVAPSVGLLASCTAVAQWAKDLHRLRECDNRRVVVVKVLELVAGPGVALIIWFVLPHL